MAARRRSIAGCSDNCDARIINPRLEAMQWPVWSRVLDPRVKPRRCAGLHSRQLSVERELNWAFRQLCTSPWIGQILVQGFDFSAAVAAQLQHAMGFQRRFELWPG